MRIRTPEASKLSDPDLAERIGACAEAAKVLKAYRIQLARESERRAVPPRNFGTNPVRVRMEPADVTAKAKHG